METGIKKTIREFLPASVNHLSGNDLLPVYQLDVFNVITQQNGDTRRITINDFVDLIADRIADYTITKQQTGDAGILYAYLYQPSPLELAKKRRMPLEYQIIKIADYPELCEKMWVGAANNATAYFWYKCDVDGTRNVNGLYMRVADWRGMFMRGYGQNAVLRTDMSNPLSAPYDGGNIGGVQGDAIRNFHTDNMYPLLSWKNTNEAFGVVRVGNMWFTTNGGTYVLNIADIDASLQVPTANENRPVAAAFYPTITF